MKPKVKITMTKSQYNEICKGIFALFTKVTGHEEMPKKGRQRFLRNYESALHDMAKFYHAKPSSNDLTYPVYVQSLFSGGSSFDNGPMMEKFHKTGLVKIVAGVRIGAGYLGYGSAGIGFTLPAKMWKLV